MRLVALAIALLTTFSTPLFAQTAADAPKTAPSKKADYVVSPDETEVIAHDSSAYNRLDKTVDLDVILFGIGPSLSLTTGIDVGYFLSRNSLLILEATSGKLGASISASGSQIGASSDLKTSSIGLHFKHFSGNSFYYRTGIDYRRAEYSYTFTNGSAIDFERFKGSSGAVDFQIGNQWQWSNFTLGCDWIGLSLPFASAISDEQLSGTAPAYYADWLKNDEDTFVKKLTLNLLRFYLGASF